MCAGYETLRGLQFLASFWRRATHRSPPDCDVKLLPMANREKAFFSCFLVVLLGLYALYVLRRGAGYELYGADSQYYYATLRSIVFDGDFDFHDEFLRLTPHPENMNLRVETSTGMLQNKYGVGWALVNLPAFLLIRVGTAAYTRLGGPTYSGYEAPFTLAVGVMGVLLTWLGTVLCYRIAKRYFPPLACMLGVLCVLLGSPLLYYTVVSNLFSHSAGFFAVAWFVHTAVTLAEDRPIGQTKEWFQWASLGLSGSLMCTIRYSNVVFAVLAVYPAATALRDMMRETKARAHIRRIWAAVAAATLGSIPPLLIQMASWHQVYGHWVVYSYGNEGFSWAHPQIANYLFSYRHGLAFYSPISLVGLVGLVVMAITGSRTTPRLLVALSAGAGLMLLYLNAAWYCWWFGDGFGARSYIEALPFLLLGLAAAFSTRQKWWRRILIGFCGVGTTWTLLCSRLLLAGYISPQGSPLGHIAGVMERMAGLVP